MGSRLDKISFTYSGFYLISQGTFSISYYYYKTEIF